VTSGTACAGGAVTGPGGGQPALAVRRQPTVPARPVDWIALGEDPVATDRERGYSDGYAAGRAAAAEEFRRAERLRDSEVERSVRALGTAVDAAARSLDERVDALTRALPGLLFELVEAVVGRELAVAVDPGRDALARALVLSPPKEPVVARLHPDDIVRLGDLGELGTGREISVVADPAVAPGDAVVEAGPSRIESRTGEALERVRAVLAGDDRWDDAS
jgi:flagellar assembly protein FliH